MQYLCRFSPKSRVQGWACVLLDSMGGKLSKQAKQARAKNAYRGLNPQPFYEYLPSAAGCGLAD